MTPFKPFYHILGLEGAEWSRHADSRERAELKDEGYSRSTGNAGRDGERGRKGLRAVRRRGGRCEERMKMN